MTIAVIVIVVSAAVLFSTRAFYSNSGTDRARRRRPGGWVGDGSGGGDGGGGGSCGSSCGSGCGGGSSGGGGGGGCGSSGG
ncbi:MAG: hypothetical protein C0482_23265 [Gordonia sp.]|nr:hypothetical protein [Gordonia sp. (in: high G+C Gram-positive bacteria)]OZG30382.1 hypothetical protein BH683_004360 [Williamsia sp. 1138]